MSDKDKDRKENTVGKVQKMNDNTHTWLVVSNYFVPVRVIFDHL